MRQQELGIKLAELRKAKGLTQEDLVSKCNINIRTLQRIEAGEVNPRSYTLQAILRVLEVNYTEFISQFNAIDKVQDNYLFEPKQNTISIKSLIGKWSFVVYIVLLLVFCFLIKFGMPWYVYILPILVIAELEAN